VDDQRFLDLAREQALRGLAEGGIPIGSVLVIDDEVVGAGHNQRVQQGNPILHGEMDALANAGRLKPDAYRRSTLYTTLSPCSMCSGTALLYRIPRVVVGENRNHLGEEDWLRERGVVVDVLDDPACIEMMRSFIETRWDVWREDIGEHQ
jgi:cytosine/creatinine deaminase